MTLNISYMGTKRYLAPLVRDVVKACRQGPALDLFAGMGAVGGSLAGQRPVWVNDVQVFASEVGKALFTSSNGPPSATSAAQSLLESFVTNRNALRKRFRILVDAEEDALTAETLTAIRKVNTSINSAITQARVTNEIRRLAIDPTNTPYRLFCLTFSGGFFSLQQAIDIDSIRYAIDITYSSNRQLERRRWAIISLCSAIARISSSTGHFAQYLDPKSSNKKYYFGQRRRSVWQVFLQCIADIAPVGNKEWRKSNKVYNFEAINLLDRLWLEEKTPSVVYADPPYTDDQYSRYYHIWETLALYDYPEASGKGRYRSDRFQTPFAQKRTVAAAIDRLASASARLGSDLVISYPTNGLLNSVGHRMEDIIGRHYRSCKIVHELDYQHSTLGASKGDAKCKVVERIYLARLS